jgi:very-short-patch-repair endonuclease
MVRRFRPCPKLGKVVPKPRRALAARGPFRVKDNPTKVYRQPSEGFRASAYRRRAERLAHATAGENCFQQILRNMGYVENVDYERESVCFYPGSYEIFDYFFKGRRVAFEIDGSAHNERGQHNHDLGRDEYFARQGIKTVRVTNRIVLGKPDLCRDIILAELKGR